jgi:Iap family predicted aminopeptidase
LRAILIVAAVVVGFSLASPAVIGAKKKSDLLTEVIANIDMELAYQVIWDLQEMGSAKTIDGENFGFRAAGSSAAHQTSLYVKDVMENRTKLTSVMADRIPLDAWEFKEAWVELPGLGKIQAASHGGSPGTGGEITAEIVDVGNGFASGYEGKDVEGKIVLANWIGNDFWVDSMAMEAYVHGARAIVVTTYDSDYGNTPGSIECHDGLYRTYWPPMLSISGVDGLMIQEMLASGEPMTVTVYSDIEVTLQEEGGFGWNVVGWLPGKNWEGPEDTKEFLIVGDHTDAWFYGGMDDNSGVAAVLVLADAFKKAIDKDPSLMPERTIVFVTHEAEEYGILDTYFDWCYGAWYEITQIHDDWVERAVGCLIMELMGAQMPLEINMAPELYSFIRNVLAQNSEKLPYGWSVTPVPHTWADHWTYSAAGVPGIEFATGDEYYSAYYYHNQFDTIDLIDFGYLRQLFEVYSDIIVRLVNSPVIPYKFMTSADRLMDRLTMDDDFNVDLLYPLYEKWGLDPDVNMGRAMAAAERFHANAAALDEALKSAKNLDPDTLMMINEQLLSIVAVLGQSLIAMGVWEQDWYPYQQAANDVIYMDRGLEILNDPMITDDDVTDAIWELNWVGIIWYYDYMSVENYYDQYSKLCGAEQASWGTQTHLLPATEIWDEYDALWGLAYNEDVTPDDLAEIIEGLETKLMTQSFPNLESGFKTMWVGLEDANSQMEALLDSL